MDARSSSNHSVTQSTFLNPCTPVLGGLDSGFQAVPAGATSNVPEWSFVVEHDRQLLSTIAPLVRIPTLRSLLTNVNPSAGMVFALNAVAQSSSQSDADIVSDFERAALQAGPLSVFTADGQVTTVHSSSISPPSSVIPAASPEPTNTGGATQWASAPPAGRTHVPVAGIVGVVFGTLLLLSLCLIALFIRRRRAQRRSGGPRALDPGLGLESAIVDRSEEGDLKARPDPLILYPYPNEKNQLRLASSHANSESKFGTKSSQAPPTAADLALANMAEMRIMRSQMQRLEMERGSTAAAMDELP
ncbi:hypothetical protein DFH09DRAFT_1359740 [Mycena vulgaris]|nr:hypothetical protein DFH09DRAFT_1359740 [Mycena vulgaris]